ncbi:MAG TPA: hypothetical protein VOA64_02465 [Candidatus Dormibacteraeota bacterium]|nr:hypothetical protein [Candidatus Dormibacteraeota bacterium]
MRISNRRKDGKLQRPAETKEQRLVEPAVLKGVIEHFPNPVDFSYDDSDYVGDAVKGALSCSYLLESISECGNRDVDGLIAQGIAQALRRYADQIRWYLKPKAAA